MKTIRLPDIRVLLPSRKTWVLIISLTIWVLYASREEPSPINRPINWRIVHDEMTIKDEDALERGFGILYDSDTGYTFARQPIDPRPMLQKMKDAGVSWESGSFKDASGERLPPEEGLKRILSQL